MNEHAAQAYSRQKRSAPKAKRITDEELHEVFERVVVPLLSHIEDQDRRKLINDSLIADIIGDPPIVPAPIQMEEAAAKMLRAVMSLYAQISRFQDIRTQFQYYPWRGRLSRARHFEAAYYLFGHECYILEERLKNYFDCAEAFARTKAVSIAIATTRKEILKLHKRAFGPFVRMRGVHVHQQDTLPREIERIGLIEVLKSGLQPVAAIYPIAVGEVRHSWMKKCDFAVEMTRAIVLATFNATRPVWLKLKDVSP
jgi:hypothetical protein